MSSPQMVIGDTFEGRYRIEALIGCGGFAHVYLATQLNIQRPVAIKVIAPRHSPDSEGLGDTVKRFEREARLLSQLQSPYTLTLFDFGTSQEGHLYMVSEFIAGDTLKQLLLEHGSLEEGKVHLLLEQLLSGLLEAHDAGVFHRDVKPANIMVRHGLDIHVEATLLDFGIAKIVGESTTDNLTGDRIIGTPRYMAPEQIDYTMDVVPGTDLYALGLVAYEMLTGRSPILASQTIQIIAMQLSAEDFSLPQELIISDRMRAVVNKMLHKDIAKRYSTARHALSDLRAPLAPLQQIPLHTHKPLEEQEEEPAQKKNGEQSERAPLPFKRRERAAVVMAAALVACLVAAGILWVLDSGEDSRAVAMVPTPPQVTPSSVEPYVGQRPQTPQSPPSLPATKPDAISSAPDAHVTPTAHGVPAPTDVALGSGDLRPSPVVQDRAKGVMPEQRLLHEQGRGLRSDSGRGQRPKTATVPSQKLSGDDKVEVHIPSVLNMP